MPRNYVIIIYFLLLFRNISSVNVVFSEFVYFSPPKIIQSDDVVMTTLLLGCSARATNFDARPR